MKPEMRDVLARQSFEEKIRKVAQLIRLSRQVAAQRVRETPEKEIGRARRVGGEAKKEG